MAGRKWTWDHPSTSASSVTQRWNSASVSFNVAPQSRAEPLGHGCHDAVPADAVAVGVEAERVNGVCRIRLARTFPDDRRSRAWRMAVAIHGRTHGASLPSLVVVRIVGALGFDVDEVLAWLSPETSVVAARVERGRHSLTTVQLSGQPIRRSHSVGVRRRTVHAGDVVSLHEFLDATGEAVDSCGEAANCVNAVCNSPGNARPRFSLRLMIPAAARADSENRCGALGSNTSVRVVITASQREDEDTSSTLGHSEELRVENPKRPPVPEFDQTTGEGE